MNTFDRIRVYFNLRPNLDEEQVIIEEVTRGVSFRGANLWILIAAIFIASLGLNVNSTAVIIGAMLISPLMGPIIGMGLAVGTNDLDLLKRALKNFSVATLISVLTAAIYFFISPLEEAQSELLARTTPTIYDVLIAFFGGAAGIIALSTRGRGGNVIPGRYRFGTHASALYGGLWTGDGAAELLLRGPLPLLHQYSLHRLGDSSRGANATLPLP